MCSFPMTSFACRHPMGGAKGSHKPALSCTIEVKPSRNPPTATKNSPQMITRCRGLCSFRIHPRSFGPGREARPFNIRSAVHRRQIDTNISARFEWSANQYPPRGTTICGVTNTNQINKGMISACVHLRTVRRAGLREMCCFMPCITQGGGQKFHLSSAADILF